MSAIPHAQIRFHSDVDNIITYRSQSSDRDKRIENKYAFIILFTQQYSRSIHLFQLPKYAGYFIWSQMWYLL